MNTRLTLHPIPPFHFGYSAYSHGWAVLAPTSWDAGSQSLGRVERLASGQVVALHMTGGEGASPALYVDVDHLQPLTGEEREEIRRKVAHMFRLDQDLSPFYGLCVERGGVWAAAAGAGFGRLLRSPTLFEDVVKTIATTNTQWSGTKRMIAALVGALGEPLPSDESRRAFPTPEAMAAAAPETFTEVARFGYRGPYVAELARRVASGELDLEALLHDGRPTAEIKRELLALKGVGPYAAATLLMLIGRYDEIGFDTVFRDFVSGRYFDGQRPPAAEMLAVYDDWGKWRYLAYWLELWSSDPEA